MQTSKTTTLIALLALGCLVVFFDQAIIEKENASPELEKGSLLLDAFSNQKSGLQVMGQGEVIRILDDDVEGSRHQRFLLELQNGLTLLVVHNIDLAPRINTLAVGDRVEFYGQYEWNQKGGLIHWTHHDPAARHVGGWLIHNDKKYH